MEIANEIHQAFALLKGKKVVTLTGAGISTESGIPDYRGPETARRARNPIRFIEYASDPSKRARYWARATIGWRKIANARPNLGHQALAQAEKLGLIQGIITQNVDRLHHAAGSHHVIELHGSLVEVVCMDCKQRELRSELQERLLTLNPQFRTYCAPSAPDGDADLPVELLEKFEVPMC